MNYKIFYYLYWDLWRFFKTLLFTSKELLVSKDITMERLKICNNCDKIKKESRFLWYKQPRCGICSCYLNFKTKLTWEICPDNPPKWKNL